MVDGRLRNTVIQNTQWRHYWFTIVVSVHWLSHHVTVAGYIAITLLVVILVVWSFARRVTSPNIGITLVVLPPILLSLLLRRARATRDGNGNGFMVVMNITLILLRREISAHMSGNGRSPLNGVVTSASTIVGIGRLIQALTSLRLLSANVTTAFTHRHKYAALRHAVMAPGRFGVKLPK